MSADEVTLHVVHGKVKKILRICEEKAGAVLGSVAEGRRHPRVLLRRSPTMQSWLIVITAWLKSWKARGLWSV